MMQYDNLIMPDKARKAARILKQYCEQNGCLYCVFHQNDKCTINCVPREYDVPPRDLGGINHA